MIGVLLVRKWCRALGNGRTDILDGGGSGGGGGGGWWWWRRRRGDRADRHV